jgi:hypothetical protein
MHNAIKSGNIQVGPHILNVTNRLHSPSKTTESNGQEAGRDTERANREHLSTMPRIEPTHLEAQVACQHLVLSMTESWQQQKNANIIK